MADSQWQKVPGAERDTFEQRFQNGEGPVDGIAPPIEDARTLPPNPAPGEAFIKIETWTWSSVTCVPPPDWVLEECDKCGDHTHRIKVLFGPIVGVPAGAIEGPGVQDSQHADANHFGQHLGERYVASRCRGTEIVRSRLTWSVSGRVLTTWDRRTIDHIKNGFVWLTDISNDPCKLREEIGQVLDIDFLERAERERG